LDCFAGISGNMMIGALLDLGLPLARLESELGKLGLEGWRPDVGRVVKRGISATFFDVILEGAGRTETPADKGGHADHTHPHEQDHTHPHTHPHSHPHPHPHTHPHTHEHPHTHPKEHNHGHEQDHAHAHPHDHAPGHDHEHDPVPASTAPHHHGDFRNLPRIVELIDASDLDESVKERSKRVFLRLARAEAKVHGVPVERVHFHEVGAVDAIVDIVGSVFGLSFLGVESVRASRVRTGRGFVQCAHGTMPVPAPATAELLHGVPCYQGDIEKEMTTPTGAALLVELAEGFGDLPSGFIVRKTGYGAGSRDLEIPNVLRAQLGDIEDAPSVEDGGPLVLEANIDDANPQIYEHVMERLFAEGALDVWITPIIMKKGRPAVQLSVLAPRARLDRIEEILFRETPTIGLRYYPVDRRVAERRVETVDLPWGRVRVKIASHEGRICNIMPEYEDCRRHSLESGVPLKEVWASALSRALEAWGEK
jgi:uncharacterized protein (TIGR00299 family) protein